MTKEIRENNFFSLHTYSFKSGNKNPVLTTIKICKTNFEILKETKQIKFLYSNSSSTQKDSIIRQ